MTSPHDVLHPKSWKPALGYSNGIAAEGRMIFTGGMVGWTGDQRFESDDFVDQVRQAMQNIVAVLAEGGAGPEHIVRLTWYVTDKHEYLSRLKELGRAYREVLGRHYPAMALVQVVALVEDRAKVEIEATAVIPQAAQKDSAPAHEHTHGQAVRMHWARLLNRVFHIDVERCACGGQLKILAAIEGPVVIVRILTHLGLPAQAPPRAAAREFSFNDAA